MNIYGAIEILCTRWLVMELEFLLLIETIKESIFSSTMQLLLQPENTNPGKNNKTLCLQSMPVILNTGLLCVCAGGGGS